MAIILVLTLVALMLIVPAALAVRKHDASTEDYLTAKRGIHWFPAGISAGVSMLSGFSFTALVGYSYVFGAFAIWFVIIRNIGEIFISRAVWPKLYDASVKHDAVTLSQLLSVLYGRDMTRIRMFCGTVIACLLTLYVSSQLQSAGIALEQSVGIPGFIGIAGAGTVLLAYCFWGGVRSSVWTDNSQAILMAITLLSIPAGILYTTGGFGDLITLISDKAGPEYLNPFSHPTIPYKSVYVFSLLFIGFCILGQPHVFSRFITVKNKVSMKKAQTTYYVTALTMNLLAVAVGVMCRGILPPEMFTDAAGAVNAESALFAAAAVLFPVWLVWLIAAGAASAAMSTGDSQIQAASSALVIDIIRPIRRLLGVDVDRPDDWTQSHWATKCATAGVIIFSTAAALMLTQHTVFDIVEFSWSTQGSLFFAPFVFYAFSRTGFAPSPHILFVSMFSGAVATLGWKFAGLNHIAYPATAGISLSVVILGIYYVAGRKRIQV